MKSSFHQSNGGIKVQRLYAIHFMKTSDQAIVNTFKEIVNTEDYYKRFGILNAFGNELRKALFTTSALGLYLSDDETELKVMTFPLEHKDGNVYDVQFDKDQKKFYIELVEQNYCN